MNNTSLRESWMRASEQDRKFAHCDHHKIVWCLNKGERPVCPMWIEFPTNEGDPGFAYNNCDSFTKYGYVEEWDRG